MIHPPALATMMLTRVKPWVFGLVFMTVSMALEILLIVVGRLKVRQDNAIIAPILLTVCDQGPQGAAGHLRLCALLRLGHIPALFQAPALLLSIQAARRAGCCGTLRGLSWRPEIGSDANAGGSTPSHGQP